MGLFFEVHITNVIQKLARHSGILYKLREILNKRQLIEYIRSYVSPVVQYGTLLYGLGPKSRLQKLLLFQKKLIRIVLRLPPWDSVIEFREFRVGTVFEHHLYEVFKFSLNHIRNGFKILNIFWKGEELTQLLVSYQK